MRQGPSILLAAAMLFAPVRSFATTEASTPGVPTPAESPAPAPGRWYGWELMVSDAVFLLMANDGRIDNPELGLGKHQFALGLGGLVLGAPALHLLHGNRRRAAIGLGVRALVVGFYAFVDDALRTGGDGATVDSGDLVMAGLSVGAAVGGLVFAFVDDVWHARVPSAAPARQAMIAPTFFMNHRGGGLGLMAAF